jgi:hypothetical protein
MNILVCGDSFAADDVKFPRIHWTHTLKTEGHEVWNLASPGCSNQVVNLQVLQGITLKPDFVIFLGTCSYRFELHDSKKPLKQNPTDLKSIKEFNEIQWKSTSYIKDKVIRDKLLGDYLITYDNDMHIIQNYSHITNSLLALEYYKIPFCWQIGGFRKDHDIVKKISAVDIISKFNHRHIEMNLWDLFNYDPNTADSLPSFHISEKSIHETFANHCIHYINKV